MHTGERFKGSLKRAVRRMASGRPVNTADRSLILTYHSVGRRDHEMNVTPASFAEQMAWLADHAATIPLREAAGGRPGVALTFDDGYRDNLLEAAPVLARHGMPSTVFIVPGRMGRHLDHDVAGDDASVLMTWVEARELARGAWTIGAHTMTHCRLSMLNELDQQHEIAACQAIIAREIGRVADGFAYPYGSLLDYSPSSAALVRESGYPYAVSNRYGPNRAPLNRFELRRIWIDRTDTLESFAAKVEGRLDRLAWLDSPAGIRARVAVNRLLRSA